MGAGPLLNSFDVRFTPESDRLLRGSENDALCQYRPKCSAANSRLFNVEIKLLNYYEARRIAANRAS
jgi:hypothetical protein